MGRPSKIKKHEILKVIENWDQEQLPPTVERLAAQFQTSKTNMHYHLGELRKKKQVDWVDNTPGTLHVVQPTHAGPVAIPLVGEIHAGLPGSGPDDEGISYQREWVALNLSESNNHPHRKLFALRVKGNSMKDAGILNGDLVVFEPECCPSNGDIVAAKIEIGPGQFEYTLKHFHAEQDTVTLKPANDRFSEKTYPQANVKVQGKVVYVICPPARGDPVYTPLE
jgi:repressor LexA